jgi:hypothetical protein
VSVRVYLEGASPELDRTCRENFAKLFARAGIIGLKFISCGSRNSARGKFENAIKNYPDDHCILMVDSEDPISLEGWKHVEKRDKWIRPETATEEQLLFMATCMESWIVCDSEALIQFFDSKFNAKQLPSVVDLENRDRKLVQNALRDATKQCKRKYDPDNKGSLSFELVGILQPSKLEKLSHWNRCTQILREALAS